MADEILTPEQVRNIRENHMLHQACDCLSALADSHEALRAERDRLAAEVEGLEAALRKVLAHTAYTVPREGTLTDLLAGLLASIERITNAALVEAPTPAREESPDA